MRRLGLCPTFSLATCGAAFASGGLWCNADDVSAKVDLRSGMQTGGANGLFGFGAEVEVRLAGTAADFRKLAFGADDLTQHWLDGEILNLEIYRERSAGPVGSVRLTIKTRLVEEGSFAGEYELSVFDTPAGSKEAGYTEAGGKITCGAE